MSAGPVVGKRCVICGEDCAGRPRVKDETGHYYCKACHEQAMAQRGAAVASMVGADEDGGAIAPPAMCAGCGQELAPEAVVCANCGYDMRLGRTHEVRTIAASGGRSESPWWLRPVDALVRPGRFYPGVVARASGLTIMLMAWVHGMCNVLARLEAMQVGPTPRAHALPVPETWGEHWLVTALGGILAGAWMWLIGGLWYRLRLRWAGAKQVDPGDARCVYLTSGMIAAIPAMGVALIQTTQYARPSDAGLAELSLIDIVPLLFAVWSVVSSFLGAKAVFRPRPVLAALWFLILPLICYGLIFVMSAVMYALAASGGMMAASQRAEVQQPHTYICENFTFQYPANWTINESDPDFDRDADVYVESPISGSMHVVVSNFGRSEDRELDQDVKAIERVLVGATKAGELAQWGSYAARGRVLTGSVDGQPFEFRAYVVKLNHGWYLHVTESRATSQSAAVEPGFDLIRGTFRDSVQPPGRMKRPGGG